MTTGPDPAGEARPSGAAAVGAPALEPLPVTAVVPAYQREDLVGRAVRSILAQRPAPPAEVIVVDDRSSDATAAAAEAAGARVVRRERNGGESAARNSGAAAATHEWIAFLDSDDEWLPGHLAALWAARDGHVLVSGACVAIDPAGRRGQVWPALAARLELDGPLDVAFPRNPVQASGALVRREALDAAGGFPEGMKRCADLDTWIRVLEHGTGVVLPEPTVHYHLHDGQVSADAGPMREAHATVVRAYAGRPWAPRDLARRLEGMAGMEDLRAGRRAGDWSQAVRGAGRLLRSPGRVRGAVEVWRAGAADRRIAG